MDYNFDCTQFITFNGNLIINDFMEISELFERIGFEVISDVVKLKNKIDYFKDYINYYVIEVKNDNFLSIVENWSDKKIPPEIIIKFLESIIFIYENMDINNLKIIFCNFAEPGTTRNELNKISIFNIIDKLFTLSLSNYDNIPDNLILEVI